ncbi:MAG: GspE/PulE family protein, partial [Phycisphaerales bacterium]
LTGHLVLSTLHTNDAAGAATRLLDMGVEPFLVASTVEGVLAQRLLRRVCKACSGERAATPEEIRAGFGGEGGVVADVRGCRECRNSGYRGRIGCYELLLMDETVRHEIMARASADRVASAAVAAGGLTTLRDSASDLVARRITSTSEAAAAVKAI